MIRSELLAEYAGDLHAMLRDTQRKTEQAGREVFAGTPRTPRPSPCRQKQRDESAGRRTPAAPSPLPNSARLRDRQQLAGLGLKDGAGRDHVRGKATKSARHQYQTASVFYICSPIVSLLKKYTARLGRTLMQSSAYR